MISLDQILVLEQKIESAVAKIAQLTAENDALRSKCAELTNALSVKTEQLSVFQANQNKIESGIIKALEQLEMIPESHEGTSQAEYDSTENSFEDNAISNDSEVIENNSETADKTADKTADEVDSSDNTEDSDSDFSIDDSEEYDDETPTETFADETDGEESGDVETTTNNEIIEEPVLDDKEVSMVMEMSKKGWSAEEIARVMRKELNDVNAILSSQQLSTESQDSSSMSGEQNQADSKPIFDIF